ncbi:MAG: NFACT RNA binding domain-containing protein, partial [Planctomycetota bacterium]
RKLEHPLTPSNSCLTLRKYLMGAVIEKVEQIHADRHLCIYFRTKEGIFHLYIELFSKIPNLILTREKEQILECFQVVRGEKRVLAPGEHYVFPPPPRQALVPPTQPITLQEIEAKYTLAEEEAVYQQRYLQLEKQLNKEFARLQKLETVLTKQLTQFQEYEHYAQWGELLKGSFSQIQRGASEFRTINYYDPEMKEITIVLDPFKTSEDNMAVYFKKHGKMKRGKEILGGRLIQIQEEAKQVAQQIQQLQLKNHPELLTPSSSSNGPEKSTLKEKKSGQSSASKPRAFLSKDRLRILVGRSSTKNDELTLRIAHGNDIFMHVHGFPGSHVIIVTPREKPVPLETLLDGATLAKYYSKAREHQKSTISYCQQKYVRKPKKAKPGAVLLQQHQSLLIEIEKSRLERLLKSSSLEDNDEN